MLATKAFGQVQKSRISKNLAFRKSPMGKNHFSDKKWLSIDGSNDWRSYVSRNEIVSRPRHQKRGGDMVLPNGLLSFEILDRHSNNPKYIQV